MDKPPAPTVPSFPEKVHACNTQRHHCDVAVSTINGPSSRRNASRKLRYTPSFKYLDRFFAAKPTSQGLEDPFLKHFRTQAAVEGNCCVFLLWGSMTTPHPRCPVIKAIDIPLKESELDKDGKMFEDKIFRKLNEKFRGCHKSLANYLGLRVVCSVRPMKVLLTALAFFKACCYSANTMETVSSDQMPRLEISCESHSRGFLRGA